MNTSTTTAEQLTAAFAEFEDTSRTLSAVYRDLEQRVARLSDELAHSRAGQARELAEKERLAARLNNLLDALPGGVVVLDSRGQVQAFNPAASDLLGPLSEGESWSVVVGRAFAPREDDGHDVSLADGRRVNIATQALSGEPGQILLLKDVTETRRLQDQLAHHKRLSAKTEMAAAMAHQIRTPVATALLSVGNVRRARDEAQRERTVERAVQALRGLERLVDDMLLFARGGRFEVSAIDVGELIERFADAVSEAGGSADFQVEFAPAPGTGRVYANARALTSIALNLVENARQAARGRGSMRIAARVADGRLAIRFHDNGPGIEAAARERIFEPFHTTRSNGTGLGLPVARAVARAHGGDLVLEDAASGASFVITLPLAGAARVAEPAPTS